MASKKVGSYHAELGARTKGFEKNMTKAQKRMATFKKGAKIAFTAIAVVAAAASAAIIKVMRDIINLAVKIDKASKVTGVTAEEFQKLTYAAEQEHASLEALEKGLVNLTVRLGYAGDGLETYLRYFRALGIEYRNQDGTLRNTIDVFMDISDVAARGEMTTEKLSAIVQLFGARMAKDLIPMLKKGSGWFGEMGKEIERTGAILSDEMVVKMKAFTDEMKVLQTQVQGGKVAFAEGLFPALDSIVKIFTEGTEHSKGFRDSLKETGRWIGSIAMRLMDFVNAMRKQMLLIPIVITKYLTAITGIMEKMPGIGRKAAEWKHSLEMLGIGLKEQFNALKEGGSYYDKYIANLKAVKEESEETKKPIEEITKALNMQLETLKLIDTVGTKIVAKQAEIYDDLNRNLEKTNELAGLVGNTIADAFSRGEFWGLKFLDVLKEIVIKWMMLKIAQSVGGGWGAAISSVFGATSSGLQIPSPSVTPPKGSKGVGSQEPTMPPIVNVQVISADPDTRVKYFTGMSDGAKDRMWRDVTKPSMVRDSRR